MYAIIVMSLKFDASVKHIRTPYYLCYTQSCMYTYGLPCIESSVEQCYNTVIITDYQLQIPLHFGSTAKTEPCEYHFNLLTQSL